MEIKVLLSIIGTGIAVISYIPYINNIFNGSTKPHAFSWFIWALLGYIAGFAQLADGGGIGASVVLTTSTISLAISYFALRQRAIKATRGDWVALIAALATVPLWVITKQPLLSVILVSFIDIVAFWPTIRKSFNSPQHETLSTQLLSAVKHCISMAAQQNFTFVTLLYPGSLAVMTILFSCMLIIRRTQLKPHSNKR